MARGMSLKQIAKLCGRPPGTVGYWVRKHGLVAIGSQKYFPKRKLEPAQVRPLVDRGLTLRQIAEVTGTSINTVRTTIIKFDLGPTRWQRRTKLIRDARENGIPEIELHCRAHGLTTFKVMPVTGARCKQCNSARVAERRRRVKAILAEEAGGACALCGYEKSVRALHFHHLDPARKKFGIARNGMTRSIAEAREEMRKCVLLCSNCHMEVEEGITQLSLP